MLDGLITVWVNAAIGSGGGWLSSIMALIGRAFRTSLVRTLRDWNQTRSHPDPPGAGAPAGRAGCLDQGLWPRKRHRPGRSAVQFHTTSGPGLAEACRWSRESGV